MAASRKVAQNDLYYCHHISSSETDITDIQSFKAANSADSGLEDYLKFEALKDEYNNNMRTYLVRDNQTEELVGYFSLKAGLVSIDEKESEFDTVPGVELANFALDSGYRRKHPSTKGSGFTVFMDLIKPIVEKSSKLLGINTLYIFSVPIDKVISNYEVYGFHRLDSADEAMLHERLKPRYDENCIFMYLVL